MGKYSDWDPLITRASNAMRYEKIAIFDQLSRFILEMMQDRLLWNTNWKLYPSFRVLGFTIFSDLE